MTWHKHASCIHFRFLLILLSILYFEFQTPLAPCCLHTKQARINNILFHSISVHLYLFPSFLTWFIYYPRQKNILYCILIYYASTAWLHDPFFSPEFLNFQALYKFIIMFYQTSKLWQIFFHCFNLNTNTYLYKLSIKSHQKMSTDCQNIVTKLYFSRLHKHFSNINFIFPSLLLVSYLTKYSTTRRKPSPKT